MSLRRQTEWSGFCQGWRALPFDATQPSWLGRTLVSLTRRPAASEAAVADVRWLLPGRRKEPSGRQAMGGLSPLVKACFPSSRTQAECDPLGRGPAIPFPLRSQRWGWAFGLDKQ